MCAMLILFHAADGWEGDCKLWRLNLYGVNMARLLFDATELERFLCSTTQSYPKLSTKALSILAPIATTFMWIFPSTSFEKQVSEPR